MAMETRGSAEEGQVLRGEEAPPRLRAEKGLFPFLKHLGGFREYSFKKLEEKTILVFCSSA